MSDQAEQIQYKDYPMEVINEMHRLGMPKPRDCHTNLWDCTNKHNYRHETIIELLMAGWPRKKIAETLDCSLTLLDHIVLTPLFQSAYKEARRSRRDALDKHIITELYQPATEVLKEVMLNPNEKGSTRLDAAKYVIDQTVGKPEQKVHQTGSILHEVLTRVDELKSRPVTELNTLLDKPKSAIDTFIDANIPEGFSVGKRGDVDEHEGEYETYESESRIPERDIESPNLDNSDLY